jgi:alanyl-tRNA synthetase
MGLERTVAVVQGKTTVYETDIFEAIIKNICSYIGTNYGTNDEVDKAVRIIVEHGRAITFLIADGVLPSNEGRGYVLRRLLRRAALYGRTIGLEKPFLTQIAGTTVGKMAEVYPELWQRQDFIYHVVGSEESKFRETLNTGLELLDGIMEKAASGSNGRISGKDAFRLYDTYGFPVELTREIAAGRGFTVDMDGFEKEMERQRQRARNSQKFGLAEKAGNGIKLDIKPTVFVGYDNYSRKTTVLTMLADNTPVKEIREGQEAGVVLQDTPFYGEMGGQMGDTGEITGPSGKFSVENTTRVDPGMIIHRGRVVQGTISVGEEVEAVVDEERRMDIARNHTATHLLQAALREVLGNHIQQRGSLVAPDYFRFDFSHLVAMTPEEIERVQKLVNEKIRCNLDVYDESMPYKKAIEEGVIALFDEKYGDEVRVLRIGRPPVSAELCGGTHVSATGEIGMFRITGESSIGSGLRRIEAVTGRGAGEYISRRLADLTKVAHYLEAEQDDIAEKAEALVEELKSERRRRRELERKLSRKDTESLDRKARDIGGIKVLAERVPPAGMDNLRGISDDLRDRLGSGIIVLGTVWDEKPAFVASVSPDLVEKGYKAGEIIKRVAEVTGGSGGGRPNIAQGGGKDSSKLDEALGEAFAYVAEKSSS